MTEEERQQLTDELADIVDKAVDHLGGIIAEAAQTIADGMRDTAYIRSRK